MAENWGWISALGGGAVSAVVWATALYLRLQAIHRLLMIIANGLHEHTHDEQSGRAVLPSPLVSPSSWPL